MNQDEHQEGGNHGSFHKNGIKLGEAKNVEAVQCRSADRSLVGEAQKNPKRCVRNHSEPATTLEEKEALEARAKRRDFAPRRDAACDPLPPTRLRLCRLDPLESINRKRLTRQLRNNKGRGTRKLAVALNPEAKTPKRNARKREGENEAPKPFPRVGVGTSCLA